VSVKRSYVLPLLFLLLGLFLPAVFRSSDLVLKDEDSFEYITDANNGKTAVGQLWSGRGAALS
jgi:hypothetical protein